MKPSVFVADVMVGCALILCGLVPGLFHRLIARVQDFRDCLFPPFAMTVSPRAEQVQISAPRWMAAIGMAVIASSLFAFLAT